MFHSMSSLIKCVKSDRERAHARLLDDKNAFESLITIGSLVRDFETGAEPELVKNPDYKPELAKMYRRLINRIAYSARLLSTMRKVSVVS